MQSISSCWHENTMSQNCRKQNGPQNNENACPNRGRPPSYPSTLLFHRNYSKKLIPSTKGTPRIISYGMGYPAVLIQLSREPRWVTMGDGPSGKELMASCCCSGEDLGETETSSPIPTDSDGGDVEIFDGYDEYAVMLMIFDRYLHICILVYICGVWWLLMAIIGRLCNIRNISSQHTILRARGTSLEHEAWIQLPVVPICYLRWSSL